MPNYLTFACRGFSLFLPIAVLVGYFYWVKAVDGGNPDRTNALLANCVDAERAAGRTGRACIGRVTDPCKKNPANAHIDDQMECDEREFVLWSQLVQKELAQLESLLKPDQRNKLRDAHAMWIEYQSADCRLPYTFFSQDRAVLEGPACTIDLKASRALQLRAWRDTLEEVR